MILSSIRDNALALALFALITALLLSSVNNLTRDRIAQAERLAAQSALLEVVPRRRSRHRRSWRPGPCSAWTEACEHRRADGLIDGDRGLKTLRRSIRHNERRNRSTADRLIEDPLPLEDLV